jgi:hypothetical protein
MPSAGITRTIDRLGRIVVPVEFRRALAIGDHDREISSDPGPPRPQLLTPGFTVCALLSSGGHTAL